MDHQLIEERDLIGAFVANRLSLPDMQAFEDHFMSCPDCLARLEQEQALADGMQQVHQQELVQTVAVTTQLGLLAWLVKHARPLAAAATIIILASVIVVREAQFQRAEALSGELTPMVNMPLIAVSPTRSASPDEAPVTRFQVTGDLAVLALEVQTTDKLTRLVLRQAEVELWQTQQAEVDANGEIILALPAAMLPAGDYLVELYAAGAAAEYMAQQYRFRVLPAS